MPKNEKGIVQVFLLLFLLIAIGFGVYLAQKTQIFKPKASEDGTANNSVFVECVQGPKEVKKSGTCVLPEWYPFARDAKYTDVEITCQDGFTQKTSDSTGCISDEGAKLLAEQVCANHNSCSNQVAYADPRTTLFVTTKNNDTAILTFNAAANAGVSAIHTAVWEGAQSEEQAKAGGKEVNYQGFGTNIAMRQVKMPSYIEYLTVDKKGHIENTHKRIIDSTARQITVKQSFEGNQASAKFAGVVLDNELMSTNPAVYNYISPGTHKLSFFVPKDHQYSAEYCKDGDCTNRDSGKAVEAGRYINLDISTGTIAFSEKFNVDINISLKKIDYTVSTANQPKVTVTPADSYCKTIFELPKDPKLDAYFLRVNNLGDKWSGSCNSTMGDFCADNISANNPIVEKNLPAGKYDYWIDIKDGYGNYVNGTDHYQFSCEVNSGQTFSAVPKDLKFKCSVLQATVSWSDTGAKAYALRIDGSPDYDAGCQSPDICLNDLNATKYSFTTTPQRKYKFWVHSVDYLNSQRAESKASENITFSCP